LELHDVAVSFRGVRALAGVTAAVPSGGVTAIIGPNGAGKTTLLNCVSGFYRHDGEITLGGQSLAGVSAHQRPSRGLARTYQTLGRIWYRPKKGSPRPVARASLRARLACASASA